MNYRSNHIRNLVARETREQNAHDNNNHSSAMERNFIDTHYLKPQNRVHVPRVLAISGGKGGVGKTLFSANLAYSCAALGQRALWARVGAVATGSSVGAG
jgi:Mrp family chromosome partitioning ATPase